MMVRLIKLTKEYYTELSEMIDEWKLDQEINHTNHSPWAIFKNDYHDFDNYLSNFYTIMLSLIPVNISSPIPLTFIISSIETNG